MIPSMDNRGPIPFAENIHRTKTFPPPCFTVGITYLESFRAPLRRLTYCLPSLPNRLKQKLVGKTNFFPIIYSPILMFKSKLSSGLLISFANERGLPANTTQETNLNQTPGNSASTHICFVFFTPFATNVHRALLKNGWCRLLGPILSDVLPEGH